VTHDVQGADEAAITELDFKVASHLDSIYSV